MEFKDYGIKVNNKIVFFFLKKDKPDSIKTDDINIDFDFDFKYAYMDFECDLNKKFYLFLDEENKFWAYHIDIFSKYNNDYSNIVEFKIYSKSLNIDIKKYFLINIDENFSLHIKIKDNLNLFSGIIKYMQNSNLKNHFIKYAKKGVSTKTELFDNFDEICKYINLKGIKVIIKGPGINQQNDEHKIENKEICKETDDVKYSSKNEVNYKNNKDINDFDEKIENKIDKCLDLTDLTQNLNIDNKCQDYKEININMEKNDEKFNINAILENIRNLNQRIIRLEIENNKKTIEIQNLKSDMGLSTSDMGTLKSDMGILTSDMGKLKSEMGNLTSEIQYLTSENNKKTIEIQYLTSENKILKSEIENLNDGMNLLKTNNNEIIKNLETLNYLAGVYIKRIISEKFINYILNKQFFKDISKEKLYIGLKDKLSIIYKLFLMRREDKDINQLEKYIHNHNIKLNNFNRPSEIKYLGHYIIDLIKENKYSNKFINMNGFELFYNTFKDKTDDEILNMMTTLEEFISLSNQNLHDDNNNNIYEMIFNEKNKMCLVSNDSVKYSFLKDIFKLIEQTNIRYLDKEELEQNKVESNKIIYI